MLDRAGDGGPVDVGHRQVAGNRVVDGVPKPLKGRLAAEHGLHRMALIVEDGPDQLADLGRIVHHEDPAWFYPPGHREACLRVLTALAQIEAQRQRGEISELSFLTRAVALLNGQDAAAVLAGSTAPNGGWLGERKHAYEQALEAAGRSATTRPGGASSTSGSAQ